MSLTYRFNLSKSGIPSSEYPQVAQQALRVARQASAVDTGAFRQGWSVGLSGDYLLLFNRVRYAGHVELGSVVHKKHQFEVRDAVNTFLGSKVPVPSAEVAGVPVSLPSVVREAPLKRTITDQEIISPALILKRARGARATISNLFKISFLAGLLAQRDNQGDLNEQSQ